MNKPKDAEAQKDSWSKADEIRWVECRIREREAIAAGKMPDFDKKGDSNLVDYRAWLLHERDVLSFQKIGKLLFSNCAEPDNQKMRADRARRKRVAKPVSQIPLSDPFI
jgi:hypothetical protein